MTDERFIVEERLVEEYRGLTPITKVRPGEKGLTPPPRIPAGPTPPPIPSPPPKKD